MCDISGVGKKQYLATQKVREFISAQPMEIQAEYVKLVERIECDGCLVEPFGKKLDGKLFEMRLRRGRQVRVIYYYHTGNHVVGLHAFVKKTQQTPRKEILQALRIKRTIEGGDYGEDK